MQFSPKKSTQHVVIGGVIAFAIVLLGACSGGGSGISSQPQQQNQAATPTTYVGPLSAAGMAVNLPSVAGFSETLTVPANNAATGTNLTVQITNSAPAVMPQLDPNMHVAVEFLYFSITTNKDVTLNGFPGFRLTVPPGFNMGSLPVKVGFYDPATGWNHIGNFVLSGRTATFEPTSTPVTLKGGVAYYAITYTCGGPSPSPIPSPVSTTVLLTATPLPIPALGGFSGDWVPCANNNAPPGTTVTVTTFLSKPTGAPTPAADSFSPLLAHPPTRLWVTIKYTTPSRAAVASTSSAITFARYPAVAFDLPPGFITSGVIFKLETFDLTTGSLLDTETGTTSGSEPVVVSFPGTHTPFIALAGHTYLWELVTPTTATPGP